MTSFPDRTGPGGPGGGPDRLSIGPVRIFSGPDRNEFPDRSGPVRTPSVNNITQLKCFLIALFQLLQTD